MLCAVGDLLEDVVVLLSGPPNRGSDVDAAVSRHRGGSAANVACAAAAVTSRARFVGQVGEDALGDRLLDDLRTAGVDTAVHRGGRTGTIVVLVAPDGERTMLSDRGAATDLTDPDPGWLDGVSVLHLPAYSLTTDPLATSAQRLAEAARDRDLPVSVDASSAAVLEAFGPRRFLDIVHALEPDVLFANADEARSLKLEGRPTPRTTVVIKRGADPTVLHTTDGARAELPPPPVETVVDTTGAGDAFAAGYLTAWVNDATPHEAVAAGHRLAARVLAVAGADVPS